MTATQEKIETSANSDYIEHGQGEFDPSRNLVYTAEDEEPEIRLRTWVALICTNLLLYVQVFALQGPPAVVSDSE